ncbi:MAG: hypothetical protein ACI86M_001550 [Saprospiraceae bacterium]|jgi:hypothetical protein
MKINFYGLGLISFFSIVASLSSISSCKDASAATENYKTESSTQSSSSKRIPSQQAKDYWYDGTAEISSYTLSQARYGELREGTAVLIYVTEPFSKRNNTKADIHRNDNVPVLKLNKTKKFLTGIYPYTMMNSTFFPFEGEITSLKIASSMQEWCGISHLEMKNEGKLNFTLNSYFEGESFENKKIKNDILEDDLWSLLRLNPESLPVGNMNLIPSIFYSRLSHQEIKAYKANITLTKENEGINLYKIEYPEIERNIAIRFENAFPHTILGWEENYYSGYGTNRKLLSTKAARKNTIKSDYWNKNHNADAYLRDELGL